MENLKVLRVYDQEESGVRHLVSIVATDEKAEYVFPSEIDFFDGEEVISEFLANSGMKAPKTAEEWANLAFYVLGSYGVQEVPAREEIFTLEGAIAAEKAAFSLAGSPSESLAQSKVTSTMQDLLNSNREFNAFAHGESDKLSEESQKQVITALIDSAGTRDLNPWLDSWLAGETTGDFSKGLVLERDENNGI